MENVKISKEQASEMIRKTIEVMDKIDPDISLFDKIKNGWDNGVSQRFLFNTIKDVWRDLGYIEKSKSKTRNFVRGVSIWASFRYLYLHILLSHEKYA